MLAIYENISFLPSPTIADSLRSSAMNQKSLFLAIIGDHRRWREVNENTIGDHRRWSLDSRLPCSCQGSKIARWLRNLRSENEAMLLFYHMTTYEVGNEAIADSLRQTPGLGKLSFKVSAAFIVKNCHPRTSLREFYIKNRRDDETLIGLHGKLNLMMI